MPPSEIDHSLCCDYQSTYKPWRDPKMWLLLGGIFLLGVALIVIGAA